MRADGVVDFLPVAEFTLSFFISSEQALTW
jgi:hypothetical protein